MKVLVIGSGGREHALIDAIDRSPLLTQLYVAPGNPGMEDMAERIAIGVDDLDGIVSFARENSIDLVVIGPEAPLVAGLADRLDDAGIAVFGPRANAAELEGSRASPVISVPGTTSRSQVSPGLKIRLKLLHI